ncbi:MAG: MraY family glycosyltransferase, partial [Myxococcota bacterium]
AAVAFAAIAVLNGDTLLAISALSLGGACFGFLRYNWQPASIYLGDAGSLFVGFFLACTALISSYTEQNVFAAGAPVLILIVPILDTTLVSMARIANGISPMNGSDDHFAIRLKAAGWSAGAVAAMAMGLTALGGIAALGMILSPGSVAAAILISFGGLFLALLLILYFVFPTPSSAAQARDTSLTSGDLAIEPIKRL